jgi:hypothetical protein
MGRAIDGLIQRSCLIGNRHGLMAFEVGFHHAALVMNAGLISVFVAQVDFHSRDAIAHSAENLFDRTSDLSGQRLVTLNVMVCADLNLHVGSPVSNSTKLLRRKTFAEISSTYHDPVGDSQCEAESLPSPRRTTCMCILCSGWVQTAAVC